MRSRNVGCPAAAVLGGLITGISLLLSGCSKSNEASILPESRQAAAPPAAAPAQPGEPGDQLKSPLLKALDDSLAGAKDVKRQDLDEARSILRKADPVLTRIKEENRQALRRMNQPPRRVHPKPAPPEKQAPQASQGAGSREATAKPETPATPQAPQPKTD
jgi:hypothetical protein